MPTPVRSSSGRLLVAAPPLDDPNFDRSVVLMLNHDDDGALGLVLNRPTEEDDVPGLDAWLERVSGPSVVFEGGPVEPHALIGLAQVDGEPTDESWAPITSIASGDHAQTLLGALATVDLGNEPDLLGGELRALRVFRGYAGWGPGQLEGELEVGAWIVVDAVADDAFSTDPAGLWRRVLERQGGRLARLGRLFPDQLESN